ncbi:MAG: conjugal transfer protein TraG N-terminal domain-containing protein [Burkholderiaceae bacterium]|nr:conjugal transfer protein TraG N-terminal domain-containing protein [Burkholderiaceae bacterium]
MWEIYAYQNNDSLFGILNAIAALTGAGSYVSALGLVAVCGFFAALLAYALVPQKLQGWYWLASVTLVLSVLFVPKVTVGIVDKTGMSAVTVVGNVPFGLAVFGSLTSTVGNTLTELYEMAMQALPGIAELPAELSYQRNGLMFGNRMIRETSKLVFQNPGFRMDMINFIGNCTMYDLASGDLPPEAFATSDDVWSLMASPNPARFTPVSDSSGAMTVMPCTDAYVNLNGRIPAQLNLLQGILARRMNPTLPGTAAAAMIAGQIQQAYIKNGIADAAADAASIIRQNAMINALNDTSLMAGQKINDPASILLAVGRAQAVAQTNASWINNGKVAEQALPVLRNSIEAITYAIFPIVILLLMLTSGRETMVGLKNYVSVLIWIQLWPPLYAILNYMATIYAARDLAAAATVGGGASALSMSTASSIYSGAISGEAVVGWMTMSIPFIAWAALKRMETLGTALMSGVQSLQGAVAGASAGAAAGNLSMGNTSMDQVSLAPMRTSAFFKSWQDSASGNTYTSNILSGRTAVRALANEGPASHVIDTKVSQQHVEASSRSVAAAKAESLAASREKAAAFSEALVNASSTTSARSHADGSASSSIERVGERAGALMQVAKSVAASTGASERQVASVAFGGSSHLGIGLPSRLKSLSPVDGGGRVFADGGKDYSASVQKQDQRIESALTSEDKAKFKEFADMLSKNTSSVVSLVSDSRHGKEIAARLSQSVARSERADASLREQVEVSETLSAAHQKGESISKDLAKDPRNVVLFEQLLRSPSSAAELIALDSMLGNFARTPVHITSPGGLPASFGDVKDEYLKAKQASQIAPDIEGVLKDYHRRVGPVSVHDAQIGSGRSTTGSKGNVRKEVGEKDAEISKEIGDRNNHFDAEKVSRTKDNHVISERSLFEKANAQVKGDPDVMESKLKEYMSKLEKLRK